MMIKYFSISILSIVESGILLVNLYKLPHLTIDISGLTFNVTFAEHLMDVHIFVIVFAII